MRSTADVLLNGGARESRKAIRREAPHAPGVYGMVNGEGELIYVGQSKSLRNRLVSYFTGSAQSKAQRIIAHTQRLLWETAPDELAALLRELALIRRWRPRFNVRGQPNRRRPVYLVLGRGPVPYIYLATLPSNGDTAVFGPVRASRDCRRAVHVLNDYFQLRDCGQQVPMRLADQREIFPSENTALCLRFDLGTCLGPCAAGCSSAQYAARVRAARGFLSGDDLSPLTRLEKAMTTAARELRYEEAAVFRDQWAVLENLHEQLQRYREAQRDYSFIYPVPNRSGGCVWYYIHCGQACFAIGEPKDREAVEECLSAIDRIYTSDTVNQAIREDIETTFLVASWFRSRQDELQRTLSPETIKKQLRGMLVAYRD
jgi:excinuclease ABC subunit C